MTSATIPGLRGSDGKAPTEHSKLLAWVLEVAELTQPERVVWADGSDEEWDRLTDQLVAAGTFRRVDEKKKANSLLPLSAPSDGGPGRIPPYRCFETQAECGPTQHKARARQGA